MSTAPVTSATLHRCNAGRQVGQRDGGLVGRNCDGVLYILFNLVNSCLLAHTTTLLGLRVTDFRLVGMSNTRGATTTLHRCNAGRQVGQKDGGLVGGA